MNYPFYSADTLDDGMRLIIEDIFEHGDHTINTKGDGAELTGILLEIKNPRARLSRTETRGKSFSCLGELCWYLSKSNDLDFISYYLSAYQKLADNNKIHGGYGPRLFDWNGVNQFSNIKKLLIEKPTSRRATIQLFSAHDLSEYYKDIPCTCTLQFLIRDGKLNMFTSMRSNDVYWGMPHDVFSFTMLQEILARDLSVELGTYKHFAGSIHLYDRHRKAARRFCDEGWQSTKSPMPPMPLGDPWPSIHSLLEMEATIRIGDFVQDKKLVAIDPYWQDLIRLLQMYAFKIHKDSSAIKALAIKMASPIYEPFIEGMLKLIV